jgi:hypothetical protein
VTGPYVPTPFATPIVSPAAGGFGKPGVYLSCSEYIFAPTAMNTDNLVPGGSAAAQTQSLADTLRRASAWVDRFCYGTDPASKGASLAASLSVEAQKVKVFTGELRLICDYKPVLEVTAVDVGFDPSAMESVGPNISASIRIGRRTIYVPTVFPWAGRIGQQPLPPPTGGYVFCVWAYVNGYPHTSLAADVVAGATSLVVESTDGKGGCFGVYPGTQLTIYDMSQTETVSISAITPGVTTTTFTVNPLLYAHNVPEVPDFIPVSGLPADVTQAAIFMTNALIKTRGDNSLVLSELAEPTMLHRQAGDEFTDIQLAKELLRPYRINLKATR